MELVEGVVEIADGFESADRSGDGRGTGEGAGGGDGTGEDGGPTFPDVEAFVEALDGVGEDCDATVQAFDARYVVSRRHLDRAVELADRARARGEGIARDRGVEILLYAAGRRQINRALEIGVGDGETRAVVLVDGGEEARAADAVRGHLQGAETLGDYDEALVREFFGVGERELAATDAGLEALVLERVALLVVER